MSCNGGLVARESWDNLGGFEWWQGEERLSGEWQVEVDK